MSPKQIFDPNEWNIPVKLVVIIVAAAVSVTAATIALKLEVAALRQDIAAIKTGIKADLVEVAAFERWGMRTEKLNARGGPWTAADYEAAK